MMCLPLDVGQWGLRMSGTRIYREPDHSLHHLWRMHPSQSSSPGPRPGRPGHQRSPSTPMGGSPMSGKQGYNGYASPRPHAGAGAGARAGAGAGAGLSTPTSSAPTPAHAHAHAHAHARARARAHGARALAPIPFLTVASFGIEEKPVDLPESIWPKELGPGYTVLVVSQSLSVFASPCQSLSVLVSPCQPLSVLVSPCQSLSVILIQKHTYSEQLVLWYTNKLVA